MVYDKSLELYDEALTLIPGASQTNAKRAAGYALGAYPVYVEKAKGCKVTCIDGHEYVDFSLGAGPIVLGYQYPAVDEAIKEQLKKGIIAGLAYPVEVEAAKLLREIVPCAEMARFLKGGGEATSAACRIARAYTGKEVIINEGYHGWQDVWVAASNDGGVPKALEQTTLKFDQFDLDSLKRVLEANKDNVAAIMVNGHSKGMSADSLKEIESLARHYKALWVMDEVISGFRLAVGGAQELYGVKPDLACFAKAMANGMPVAAIVGRKDVMEMMTKLSITVTYGGEALSLAAAIATMKEIRDKNVPAHLKEMGMILVNGVNESAQRHGLPIKSVYGAMSSIAFDFPRGIGGKATFYMLQEMAARGVLLRPFGNAAMTFSHTREIMEDTVRKLDEVFGNLKGLVESPELLEQQCRRRRKEAVVAA